MIEQVAVDLLHGKTQRWAVVTAVSSIWRFLSTELISHVTICGRVLSLDESDGAAASEETGRAWQSNIPAVNRLTGT